MIVFFRCVAEAVAERGVRGLLEMVPGGTYAYDVASAALKRYKERRKDDEIREEIRALAQSNFEDARRAAEEAVAAALPATPVEDRLPLELFLSQIPGSIRQSLKRPDDPAGLTVSPAFSLASPDDVLRVLPSRPPLLSPGDGLAGKPGWVLDRLLGVGGFGEVWLAKHPRMASLVGAVKFCRPREADALRHEGELIDRVMRAGRHPGVVPLLDVNLDGDRPWLMFEYVEGGDLGDQIRAWQARPAAERVEWAVTTLSSVAGAVGHLHAASPPLVHRDLKPSNVLWDGAAGRPRVTDLGIGGLAACAELRAEVMGTATRGGRMLSQLRGACTPLYASPQQRDGADPDPRDDVHALGVIGYQMLTGLLDQGAGPEFADDLREAGAGDAVAAILGRCVSRRPDRRPATARELASELDAIVADWRAEFAKLDADVAEERPPEKSVYAAPAPTRRPELTAADCVGRWRARFPGRNVDFDFKADNTFTAKDQPDKRTLAEGLGLVRSGKGYWEVEHGCPRVVMTHVWVVAYWKEHRVVWIDRVPIEGVTPDEIVLASGNPLRRL